MLTYADVCTKMLQLGLHPDTPDAEAQKALKNANIFLTLYLNVWLDADALRIRFHLPPSCFIRVAPCSVSSISKARDGTLGVFLFQSYVPRPIYVPRPKNLRVCPPLILICSSLFFLKKKMNFTIGH